MQNYEIEITEHAFSSLREISHYITYDLMSPQAAVNILKSIWDNINSLNSFPARIPLTAEEPWHGLEIHKMISGNYLIYFTIDEDNGKVQVTDVIYARRDQRNALNKMPNE